MKICTNCGQANDNTSDICTSCGYVLPERKIRDSKLKRKRRPEDLSHDKRYSFGKGEKEVAEFKPSQQIFSYLARSSLFTGIPAAIVAVFLIVMQTPNQFGLFTLVWIGATFLFVWGMPAFFSRSMLSKIIHNSEYVITNKRVIIYFAQGSRGPHTVPLDRISYAWILPHRSIYSNLILVTFPIRKNHDRNQVDMHVDYALPKDNVVSTLPASGKEKESGMTVRFMRKISSMRGLAMRYLSCEDALKAEEAINRLLKPQS